MNLIMFYWSISTDYINIYVVGGISISLIPANILFIRLVDIYRGCERANDT